MSLSDFDRIARGYQRIEIDQSLWPLIEISNQIMEKCIAEGRTVYGINTGFGPLANRNTPKEKIPDLQRNLIYHLATGVGAPLAAHEARGLTLARLLSITACASGASSALVVLIVECLNAGLAPFVPQKGTVGASGDLTPMAHVALAFMGEGGFYDREGTYLAGNAALKLLGLAPYSLVGRDGLALVNGTSAMTAIAALSSQTMRAAVNWSLRLSAAHAEILCGLGEAWDPAFGRLRSHPGQVTAHARLNALIANSSRIQTQRIAMAGNAKLSGNKISEQQPQDPYSIRCVPQIIGAVIDCADHHDDIVLRELHAVTDNPVFINAEPFALHGGNFFGQHVAFASDHLANAATMIAVLAERQLARLTDEKQSGLPAFLQPNETGLHSGLMGAQVTASALLAEIRTRAIPGSIQSIPTNANNQDVVSMGTIAARRCRDILEDVIRIIAIQALSVAQAIDIIGPKNGFSDAALQLHGEVRSQSAFIKDDRPLYQDIEKLARHIGQSALADAE